MKIISILFLILLSGISSMAQSEVKTFKRGDKVGLLRGFDVVISAIYDDVYPFRYDPYASVVKDNKYGIVNFRNKIIVPIEYDNIKILEDGKWGRNFLVSQNGKYGLFSSDGKLLIPVIYQKIEKYLDGGLRTVKLNNKIGMMDSLNKIKIPIEYDSIPSPFVAVGNLILLINNGKRGIISKQNKIIVPFGTIETASPVIANKEVLICYVKNKKIGFMTAEGKPLIDPIFDEIEMGFQNKGFSYVKKGDTLVTTQKLYKYYIRKK